MLSSVDFPLPDGPITATASPARTTRDTPSRAVESLYSLRTFVSSTTASAFCMAAILLSRAFGDVSPGR